MMHGAFPQTGPARPDADAVFRAMLQFAGTAWPFAEHMALRFVEATAPASGEVLHLRTRNAYSLYVRWLDFPMQAVTGLALEPEACESLPTPLRLALLRGMLVHLFSLLPPDGLFASGADPQEAEIATVGAGPLRWLDVTVTLEGTGAFRFLLGATSSELVAEFRPPIDPDPERRMARQVPMSFDIRLATLWLPQSDIAGLETGDLLVLPKDLPPPALCGFGQIIELEPADNGHARVRAGSPKTSEAASEILRSGWMRLDILAGEYRASLADLEDWAEASPVALGFPVPEEGQAASVFLQGAAMARGEFLRIDDRIALRITSLAPANGKTGMEEP